MKRTITVSRLAGAMALAAVLALWGLAGNSRPAAALTNCAVADMTFDAQEQEFLRLINQYRAQNGRPALTASVNLNRAASWHARDMAVNRYFSHTDSLGRSFSTRIANCDGKPYNAENIAAGTYRDTAAEVFAAWRNSSGHNANMLNATYKQLGIARYYDAASPYKWYWVLTLSTTNDGTSAGGGSTGGGTTPAPTPSPTATAQPPASPSSPTAVMTSPVDGSTLGTTQTFVWAPGSSSSGYYFYMGTTRGSNNMLGVNAGKATSLTVTGIPRTGATVYVRLWSLTSSGWKYADYTYRLPQ
jgi:uncharacterized protein YkwD